MSSEMKRTLCNELIDKGLVTEGDVIRHSYTHNRLDNGVENMSRTESKEKLSPTLDTRCDCLGVVVKEPTALQKEVCNKAIEQDLIKPYEMIDYTYSRSRLDEIKEGKIEIKNSSNNQVSCTLTTQPNNFGVCVPNPKEKLMDEIKSSGVLNEVDNEPMIIQKFGDRGTSQFSARDYAHTIPANPMSDRGQMLVEPCKINVVGNYSPSGHEASRIVHPDGVSPTIKENHGTVTATIEPSLRIRKLTPKECWRLMGFGDDDFARAEKVCSNSQLYKQAGNSIVVNVLMAIFKELFVPKQTRSEWLHSLLNT